jgi:hypothetical protein
MEYNKEEPMKRNILWNSPFLLLFVALLCTFGFGYINRINADSVDHFYTIDADEKEKVIFNLQYKDEGIACYVFSKQVRGTVPLYRAYNNSAKDHLYTTAKSEMDVIVRKNGYKDEGVACYVHSNQVNGTVPLYRIYNSSLKDHFYTIDKSEMNTAIRKNGYKDEGIACYVYPNQVRETIPSGTIPFFRAYSLSANNHFYTTDNSEMDVAVKNRGYKDEGTACYVHSNRIRGTAPLYRASNSTTKDHFYTMDESEIRTAVRNGYKDEGIECYIYKNQDKATVPLYRAFNSKVHFYTTNKSEIDNAGTSFKYEGIVGFVYPSSDKIQGIVPLYRLCLKSR